MHSAIGKCDHEYILQPVSATACVKRNLSEAPLRSRSTPRITCDLKLEQFPLSLSDSQYQQVVKWNKEYDRLEKARHYRKWRPSCSVKENPHDWWQYPIQYHLDRIHKKYCGRNWSAAQQRARDIVRYVDIYAEHLRNPATVSTDQKAHKLKVEQELNYSELCCLREVAMELVTKELAQLQETKPPSPPVTSTEPTSPIHSGEGILHCWFPTWGGWYTSDTHATHTSSQDEQKPPTHEEHQPQSIPKSPETQEHEKQASPSLEEEILYVLSDSIENNTFMKRDAVLCQLSFTLKQSSFSLSSTKPPLSRDNMEENEAK